MLGRAGSFNSPRRVRVCENIRHYRLEPASRNYWSASRTVTCATTHNSWCQTMPRCACWCSGWNPGATLPPQPTSDPTHWQHGKPGPATEATSESLRKRIFPRAFGQISCFTNSDRSRRIHHHNPTDTSPFPTPLPIPYHHYYGTSAPTQTRIPTRRITGTKWYILARIIINPGSGA